MEFLSQFGFLEYTPVVKENQQSSNFDIVFTMNFFCDIILFHFISSSINTKAKRCFFEQDALCWAFCW